MSWRIITSSLLADSTVDHSVATIMTREAERPNFGIGFGIKSQKTRARVEHSFGLTIQRPHEVMTIRNHVNIMRMLNFMKER